MIMPASSRLHHPKGGLSLSLVHFNETKEYTESFTRAFVSPQNRKRTLLTAHHCSLLLITQRKMLNNGDAAAGVARPMHGPQIQAGYLYKMEGTILRKTYPKYFFRLKGHSLTYWERAGLGPEDAKGVVSVLNCFNVKEHAGTAYTREKRWRGLELCGAHQDKAGTLLRLKERASQLHHSVRSLRRRAGSVVSASTRKMSRSVVLFAQTNEEFREWKSKLGEAFRETRSQSMSDLYTPKKAQAVKSVIEGWLLVNDCVNGLHVSSWSRLYVKLFEARLEAFPRESARSPRFTFRLTKNFWVAEKSGYPNSFVITDGDEEYWLACEKKEEKAFWMQTVAKCVRKLSGKQFFSAPQMPQTPQMPPPVPPLPSKKSCEKLWKSAPPPLPAHHSRSRKASSAPQLPSPPSKQWKKKSHELFQQIKIDEAAKSAERAKSGAKKKQSGGTKTSACAASIEAMEIDVQKRRKERERALAKFRLAKAKLKAMRSHENKVVLSPERSSSRKRVSAALRRSRAMMAQ